MDCLPSPKSYFIDQTNGLTKRYGMDLAYLGLGSAWCIHMLYSEAQLLRDLYSTSCLLLCSIFHYPHKPAIIIHLGTLCTSSLFFRKPKWKAHRSIIWTSNIQYWHQAACAPYHKVILNRFKHFCQKLCSGRCSFLKKCCIIWDVNDFSGLDRAWYTERSWDLLLNDVSHFNLNEWIY